MVTPTDTFRNTKSGASAIVYGLIAGLFSTLLPNAVKIRDLF